MAALSTSPRLSTWQRVFAEQLAITFAANSRWIRDAGYDEPPASQPADVWAVGTWKLGSSKARLSISGAVYRPEEATFIFLNEQIPRPVNIRTPYERLNAPRSGFGFHLDGATLAEFPRRAILAVGTRGGPLVDNQTGEESQVISVPNGTGQLIPLLRSTHVINKHGRLTPRLTGATEWQTKVLGAHVRFAEYFKETFGYDLFVVYGVLLGLVREGNFIDSDDDFDIAYVSKHTAVADVKAETISIVERLSADGYTLKSNALRRMIKVLVDDVWLDCFSGWIEDGRVWMPQTTSFPGDRDVFFPLRGAELQGIDILIPNRAEYFLESVYGEKWLVPDPGYRAPSRPPEILKHIAKSYLSPAEVEELGARGVAIKFPPTKQTPA